jgi:hypothetical protein
VLWPTTRTIVTLVILQPAKSLLSKAILWITTKLPWLIKLVALVSKLIGYVTPQGLHVIYTKLKNGKCTVEIDDVMITDNDEGFSATIKMKVRSKNKEALTSIKTEIENKPLNNI